MKRRLAAILMADVAGFSSMMQADEAGTLHRLSQRRAQVLDPGVRTHNGRMIKLMGDGVQIEFASALSAVEAALDLQAGFKKPTQKTPATLQVQAI